MVRWRNVATITRRELRDQLRDRRTLFMVFVLPVLLYPLLLLGMTQLTASFQEQPRTVVVAGAGALPERIARAGRGAIAAGAAAPLAVFQPGPPALLAPDGSSFAPDLFDDPRGASLLRVVEVGRGAPWDDPGAQREILRRGEADAIVIVPPDVASALRSMDVASIPVVYDSASDRSRLTRDRVDRVLARWSARIVEGRRTAESRPPGYTDPVRGEVKDVATSAEAGGSLWSKLFPFLLVLMSLTGAFYPAVDLCAGEKERGTMETLLISPASRGEIVLGKFFTVMTASMATALLNLASLAISAAGLAMRLAPGLSGGRGGALQLAMPGGWSIFWMLLLLVPLSAFLSALCLALAVLARSMKEGQYYMTPLYLVALPLAFYGLVPGVELTLLTSLLPITGVSLLLRSLMQGDYATARAFFLPVFVPIVLWGLLALRWAIDQFRSESVLFREAERFDLQGWVRYGLTHKPERPTPGQVMLCFALILVAAWYVVMGLGASLATIAALHVAAIAGVPVLMAVALTRDPLGSLRLQAPRPLDLAIGLLLAVALCPLVNELRVVVEALFPAPEAARESMAELGKILPNTGIALLVLALLPAISEELAFRGFILGGLERAYRNGWAVILSALLFGFIHVLISYFQQLFNATLLGLVLGLLALKSRSLWPGVVFHATNNGLAVLVASAVAAPGGVRLAGWLLRDRERLLFAPGWVVAGAVVAGILLVALLRRRPAAAPPAP